MISFRRAVRDFFFPPASAARWVRALPYIVLGVLTLGALVGSAYAWDYTNSPPFCGTQCHTMPPEYTTYLTSPHARIACVECHIGREFVGNQVWRKAGDVKHIVSLAFHKYEFPITAGDMRPARETCERCHSPEKFSDDSLREIRHYGDDQANSPTSTFLVLKTGGGSKRVGLGRGIHWHIENPIVYYAADAAEQEIPYVRVTNADGTVDEYLDIDSGLDPASIPADQLEEMDCITCHNRITHLVNTPEASMDAALTRGTIDSAIPEIRYKGVEALKPAYPTQQHGLNAIAGLEGYYRVVYPDFYAANTQLVQTAIAAIQDIYSQSVYIEQKSDWNSHPNNIGHKDFPGCFRCHDGKHLNADQEAIRLECNLCHSIPVVAQAEDFVSQIEIPRGLEPDSHKHPNWIARHRTYFDQSCQSCHTTENAGGTDNSSFCSNSACHGSSWAYAGLDAPQLADIVAAQLPVPTPMPTAPPLEGAATYANLQPVFELLCGACHGDNRAAGLKLTTYADLMAGSDNGPVVVRGDPDASLLVQVQSERHFGTLDAAQLEAVRQWIAAGAPEG